MFERSQKDKLSAANRLSISQKIAEIWLLKFECEFPPRVKYFLGRVRLGYSGIRIYSGIYSGYSAPGSRIAGMEIQVFRNENNSQTNAYSHYSNYSYSGLIPNERALSLSYCFGALFPIMLQMRFPRRYEQMYYKKITMEDFLVTDKATKLCLWRHKMWRNHFFHLL